MLHQHSFGRLLAFAVALAVAPPAMAQPAAKETLRGIKIKEIRSNPRLYLHETIEIEGFVSQRSEGNSQTSQFFVMKDDWGGFLRVRTSGAAPNVGDRILVIGGLSLDEDRFGRRDLLLSEEQRVCLSGECAPVVDFGGGMTTGVATGAGDQIAVPPPQRTLWQTLSDSPPLLAAFIVLTVVFVGILIALAVMVTGRRDERRTAMDQSMPNLPLQSPMAGMQSPEPVQVVEGKTIKFHAPPPGTLKLLPGWFEVVGGDDMVRDLRFYKVKGEAIPETTFGRAAGKPYTHVQLKPMTVSSRQASLRWYEGAAPTLVNYASSESNPTRINGREMSVNEATQLSEGDRVEMGEVAFTFHAS